MTRKQLKISIWTFIIALPAFNMPYLPGPNSLNNPAQILLAIGQIVGMIGIFVVPIGILFIVFKIQKKESFYRALIITTPFFAALISLLFLSNWMSDFSRNIAIKNGNKLAQQIETYHDKNGVYPEFVNETNFKIPSTMIIGIKGYKYSKLEDNFELTFYQNVLLGFNFEIVTYNKKGEQKARGGYKALSPTSDKNWKYEVYD